eukprot:TRINITY_DN257_c0_g1_i1.p1 TRINITY_DN257_c0_g1~~TRINITY_DN257_c0_g1_i1.p1  ORF type:complete len:327 (-),score=105.32 TRINITY_DN257_c0_g1_i1:37-1017(-)
MAKHQKPARVIICTDGLCNVGLGSLEDVKKEEEKRAVEATYKRIATIAKEHGVSVSIMAIQGTDASLTYLSEVAEDTAGDVDVVDPFHITENFANILAQRLVATNCLVTFRLHDWMRFRNEDVQDKGCVVQRDVGNVTSDSTLTFEYELKKAEERTVHTQLDQVPFQVLIRYSRTDGTQCIRVITQTRLITRDRAQAEADVDATVLAANAVQQSARFATTGDYSNSRAWMLSNQRLMARTSKTADQRSTYSSYVMHSENMDMEIRSAMATERLQQYPQSAGAPMQYSLDDMMPSAEVSRARKDARSDRAASMLTKAKKATPSMFKK